jgi:hypothetical protein
VGGGEAEVVRVSWLQACAARLAHHALAGQAAAGTGGTPGAIAARMCGAHAQVMTAAEWSIGLRLPGASRSDIQSALWSDRSLVKTFGPRGTVHLLPAADLPMWIGAMSAIPRPPASPASNYLTPDQAETVLTAIGTALQDAELTVDELTEAVVTGCGSWAGDLVLPGFAAMWPRWRQALSLAGARGVLCFGPDRGRNVTYTSPRRWLPGFEPASAQDALGWLVTQFLSAYGPATSGQFAQWLAAPRRWAAELFATAPGLQQAELNGVPAWLPARAPQPPASARGVWLLPYFDPYVVGCHPRGLLFPGPAAGRALSRTGQAGARPVLLIDGTVGGIWHHRRSGRSLTITVEPFSELTAHQQRELSDQAARLAEFFGCAPRLTLGLVTVRSHL